MYTSTQSHNFNTQTCLQVVNNSMSFRFFLVSMYLYFIFHKQNIQHTYRNNGNIVCVVSSRAFLIQVPLIIQSLSYLRQINRMRNFINAVRFPFFLQKAQAYKNQTSFFFIISNSSWFDQHIIYMYTKNRRIKSLPKYYEISCIMKSVVKGPLRPTCLKFRDSTNPTLKFAKG